MTPIPPIPEDLRAICSNCSGKGFVDALSFSDPADVIQKTCRICKGKGWLWALDQSEIAERIAKLTAEVEKLKAENLSWDKLCAELHIEIHKLKKALGRKI